MTKSRSKGGIFMSSNSAVQAKKKINWMDVLMSVMPLLIMLCLNTAATLPAVIAGFYELSRDGDFRQQGVNITDVLKTDLAQTLLSIGFIVYALACIVIFHIWYKKSFLKKQITITNKEVFKPKTVILTVIGALGVWALINFGLMLIIALMPDLYRSFIGMMENSGIGTNFFTTLIYVSFLGPIAEEYMFRGVTQAYLRRSGLPATAVIIGQAVLFGIAHMNPIQSTYAVFIGAFIGLLRYKYGNIRICCLAHIINNVTSSYGEILISKIGIPDSVSNIMLAVMVGLGAVAIVFILKTPAVSIDLKPAQAQPQTQAQAG